MTVKRRILHPTVGRRILHLCRNGALMPEFGSVQPSNRILRLHYSETGSLTKQYPEIPFKSKVGGCKKGRKGQNPGSNLWKINLLVFPRMNCSGMCFVGGISRSHAGVMGKLSTWIFSHCVVERPDNCPISPLNETVCAHSRRNIAYP